MDLALFAVAVVALTGLVVALARTRVSGHRTRSHGTVNGQAVRLHILNNGRGMTVAISEYGATLTSVRVPDRFGKVGEVTLGHDHVDGYVHHNAYLGSTVGRYANRLREGQFNIDGAAFQVTRNNNGQHLHGGGEAMHAKVWTAEVLAIGGAAAVRFTHVSPAGDEGYPGNLTVAVTYTLPNDSNELRIDFAGTTDAATLCNLTNHAFFNLAGQGDILDHTLTIPAERFIPTDAALIATGERAPVEGTPFDFRHARRIGQSIGAEHLQLRLAGGYDHCFDLGVPAGLRLAARATEATSGRSLDVLTDAPGIQFYAGNFLDGSIVGRGGRTFGYRQGFCLEPGLFPDSPNQASFHRAGYPSGVLRPGERYRQRMIYRFGT
ncbi:MAG: galactose mutarotase [Verrucomicrobiae bacterium]|jgi:aldose 1-epimerase|nr:galactose mutarotase [Verrucomicrobiae bacterium]